VNNLVETELQDAPKFDPHRKLGFSTEAPAPSPHYDVTYDTKIGKSTELFQDRTTGNSVSYPNSFDKDTDPAFSADY
jgi:hypothetical protein